jgi:hypothetical protein
MKRLLTVSIAIAATAILSASRSIPPETRTFTYTDGKNGHGGETFTRNGDRISGDMFVAAKHAHYEGRIAADGTIPRLEIRTWATAAEAKHPRMATAIVGRDSGIFIQHVGNRADTTRFAAQPGMIPMINPSMGLAEVAIAHARSMHTHTAKAPIVFIDALNLDSPGKIQAGPVMTELTFLPADTVRLSNGKSTDQLRFIVGADGKVREAKSGSTANDNFVARAASKRADKDE